VSGGIFVLNEEELVEMHEQPYDSEDLPQTAAVEAAVPAQSHAGKRRARLGCDRQWADDVATTLEPSALAGRKS
jgi:hypothetical protein